MIHLPILAAEDNEDDAFLLRQGFAKAKLHNPLHVVSDGEQALAYLKGDGQYSDRKTHPFPVLLLLDLKMPRMNGHETLAAIRKDEQLKRLIVIFLTVSPLKRDINEAFDLRANSYLVKPATPDLMADALSKVKAYWLGFNQHASTPTPGHFA
jgi:CheY-like chemotaxis protein